MRTLSTIFCIIQHVQPLEPPTRNRWAVSLADGEGETVTIELGADDLQTYERFQAAVLRHTGCRFRYRPAGDRWHTIPAGQAGHSA